MNTKYLKEELNEWQKHYSDPADRSNYDFFTALTAAVEHMEASERERDELRAIAEEQSKLAGSNAARAQKAEAELARRDAAAGEPVVIMSVSKNSSDDFQFEIQKRLPDGVYELYAAAPPAVLRDIEPLIEGALKLHGLLTAVDGHSQLSDGFRNGARWAAKELGAQQQKVVELYKRKSMEVISGQRYSYVLLDDLLPELDAANVKWEVRK